MLFESSILMRPLEDSRMASARLPALWDASMDDLEMKSRGNHKFHEHKVLSVIQLPSHPSFHPPKEAPDQGHQGYHRIPKICYRTYDSFSGQSLTIQEPTIH